jgi:hypothetical protein
MNATWPFAKLRLDEFGVTLGSSSIFVRLLTLGSMPTIRTPWSATVNVRPCLGRVSKSDGIRIQFDAPDRPVIFWCSDKATIDILATFERHGVQVDPNVYVVPILGL